MGYGVALQASCLEGFDSLMVHQNKGAFHISVYINYVVRFWAVSIRGITLALQVRKKGSSPLRSTKVYGTKI
jgi:hypothetical protein